VAIAQRWPVEDHTPTRSESAVPRVLIADDQPDVLEALRLLLKGEGYRIESAGSPAAILEAIDGDEFDAVLMDLNYARDTTSGQEGLDLISQLRSHDSTLPIVVMTAWGSVEVAVDQGVVTLTGHLPSNTFREKAVSDAERATGVKRVIDKIEVP